MPESRAKPSHEYRTAVKACETCSAPIKLINMRDLKRKRFCSFECKTKSQIGQKHEGKIFHFSEARKCKNCGIDFIAKVNRQVHCSGKCTANTINSRARLRNNDLRSHLKRLLVYKKRKNLSLDFLLGLYEKQKGLCALSGIKMTWDILSGKVPTNVSIDRISSYEGYSTDNVQLVCTIVNLMKHNLGQLEFIELCQKIGGYRHP